MTSAHQFDLSGGNLTAATKKLLKHLNALNYDELRILWVFSVVYEPVNQTTVKDILSYLNWELEAGGRISPLLAKPLREKLVDKKLLEAKGSGYICNPLIVEVLAQQVQREGVYKQVVAGVIIFVPYLWNNAYGKSGTVDNRALRDIRDALYLNDEKTVIAQLNSANPRSDSLSNNIYLERVFTLCTQPFDEQWFSQLSETIQALVLSYRVRARVLPQTSPDYTYLMNLWDEGELTHFGLRRILLEWRIENLQLEHTEKLFDEADDWHGLLMQAWLLSLKGLYDEAIPLFSSAQKGLRKAAGDNKVCLMGLPGLHYCLSLLQSSDPKHGKELDKQVNAIGRRSEYSQVDMCFEIIQAVKGVLSGGGSLKRSGILQEHHRFSVGEIDLMLALSWHWLGERPRPNMLTLLAEKTVSAYEEERPWFVRQSMAVLRHFEFDGSNIDGYQKVMDETPAIEGGGNLMSLINIQAPWERALQALQSLNPDSPNSSVPVVQETRIVWMITDDLDDMAFQPKEQKVTKSGTWTKGRNISLKRLMKSLDQPKILSEQDASICRCIEKEYDYYGSSYSLSNQRALQAAVGHPLLFWVHKPDKPVEILAGDVELIVQEKSGTLSIKLHPELSLDDFEYDVDWLLQKEGAYRLRFYKFNAQHQQISKILGDSGLTVPSSAKASVLKSISAIAPLLSIQSDIGGGTLDAKEVQADTQLYMQVQPQKNSFLFNLCVQPLGNSGPQFRPGEGRATVMAEVDGERLHASRNLALEEDHYHALLKDMPDLEKDEWDEFEHEHECEWHLSGEEALNSLFQLQAYGDPLTLQWPKGGQLKFNKESTLRDMKASVRQSGDWFALEGGLTLDDGQVMSMAKLMTLMDESPGRFIRLGDDSFLTLTRQLSQRLQALKRHGEQQFHPLALVALEELTDGMQLTGDKDWKKQKKIIKEAYSLNPPTPPTLQAELRDYQQEGFTWLYRLAHWGAGACLADDMGLGKTVQALAFILTRAEKGPTLILAPTSVCMNWVNEAARFAPTLNVIRFGGANRGEVVEKAGPYDLVVCSYGLLQTEAERLQSLEWHTIVADEAQALKNPQTKRTQAAMGLKGAFKIVTTGTPIENHLGELWSLFRFINPGLLGSQDSFNKRFAGPIENDQDKPARLHLKRLVQPFMLRRLKTDVLTELPPRTEITINVPQSEEEAVFYEALRRKAMDNLSKNSQDKPGQKQLKILAEIMKLRRACCNPRLVAENSQIPSSKMAAFGEIVDELKENNHRALVFSQFVGHLALIREFLDERGIDYQYLDGSTTVKKREKAVNAFQAGEGDLFLISLKAGGSGLNLTAADYVVHMDPWWNPAVEDQASDRAHRLGQKRPVTIYRLVSENTIEQKIIALHGKKRDLADSLLEGSDVSGKLSAEEIMGLIEEG